ncbi:MAG: bifunctional diguanylate cyclase/phosphodiesterase [Acidobacteriales bacterium]|nr:bifunctional diguanylate cyclase/phosphodiesterase [Terriglobales bacterium]
MRTLFGPHRGARFQSLFDAASGTLACYPQDDALTGLPNRFAFEERFARAIARAHWRGWFPAVVLINIGHFRRINATLGHAMGDNLLRQVARRLSGSLEPNDFVARMSGSEFALALCRLEDPRDTAWKTGLVLDALNKPFEVDDQQLYLPACMGLSVYPEDGLDAETLLRHAGAAAFRAAPGCRQQVVRFTRAIGEAARTRLSLETDMRRALEGHEFRLLYQPQVDPEGRLAGLEALLEWNHPRRGRIAPAEFIPIAEESGMIVPIGAWVLGEACRQNVEWQDTGHAPVRISVNVSAVEFARPDFVHMVTGTLSDTGLNPKWLALEVTESTLMRDVEESVRRMTKLRGLGVRIAIDDFGTGYSSLAYLRRFPLDALKIDRSFLLDVTSGTVTPLVETVIRLAHGLGLRVVAEGVENERQLGALRRAGCDLLQGHLFGQSLPPSTVANSVLCQDRLAAMAPVN